MVVPRRDRKDCYGQCHDDGSITSGCWLVWHERKVLHWEGHSGRCIVTTESIVVLSPAIGIVSLARGCMARGTESLSTVFVHWRTLGR